MRSLAPLLLLCAAAAAAPAPASAPRKVSDAEARRLLKAPVRLDARAGAVLKRSAQAYRALKFLLTESTAEGVRTVTRLKRPGYYHSLQAQSSGELVRLSVCDGRHYYEYQEASRQYVERPAALLPRLPLPVNARPFFVDVSRGQVMETLKGAPAVREYAFAYAGEERVAGRPADRVRVSTLARNPDGWRAFDSLRLYDHATGYLVQVRNGSRTTRITNHPNAQLPTAGFTWKPIPGGTRSFD